jgi:RNA polymerase sigma-70 factor (ECF subfamily)
MDHIATWRNEVLILRTDSESPESSVYAERTDSQLVELTLAGDEVAFECIFDRHKRRVAVLASRFFQEPSEIEEIIQVSFTKAFFEMSGFRGSHDFSLASWLNRIVTNTCLNALKARTTKVEHLSAVLTDRELEIFAVDLRRKSAEDLMVQRDLLEKLLSTLMVEDRVLLQMLYAQEISVAEVASIFGWSRSKVKIRAFRARRSLGRSLKNFL